MQPLARAELALTGLSIGDAFGQMFFGNTENMSMAIDLQALPAPPWYLTDDSIMAIGIVETLRDRCEIDRDYLASRFAINYRRNPRRGYGGMAHHILQEFCKGEDWRVVAPAVPFTIWCAVRHLHDFKAAMWATVSGLGDRDTTCAIVGGIVALSVGEAGIPQEWLQARESLTEWESAQVSWDIN